MKAFAIPSTHNFSHCINTEAFEHFSHYDYKKWMPPKSRRNFVSNWIGDGEYLDIGCGGYPVTMDVADGKNRGFGADIAPEAARRYRHYFKEFYFFDIENIDLREIPQLCRRFSAVVLSETLEHFHDPRSVLLKVRRFLKPSGKLLITYPNAFGVAQYIDYLLHGGSWHRYKDFHESHIFLVRKNQLEKLFIEAGFEIVHFDFRASNVAGSFPSEGNRAWKYIACWMPSFLGHQFFYVLKPAHPALN
jgi:SAM-dependent methyltransferase